MAAATRILDAAWRWLESLDQDQRRRAVFPFDSAERFVWDYRPVGREGLAFGEMTAVQGDAARSILRAALSDRGASEVQAIMALEPVLGDLERAAGRSDWARRDPGRYWFAIFGEPGDRSAWAWRLGGHHVSVQVTVADGRVIGSAPSFLGANPATVLSGPPAGHRAIDGEEALGRSLLGSLSPAQRRIAVVDPVAPPDILGGNGRRVDPVGLPSGIRHDDLATAQRERLEALIRHYLGRSGAEVAEAEWSRIRAAGLGAVTFAWAGSDLPGRGHYYAIRGPTLVIEYDNTQDGANHIHSVWRDPINDWGEDLLAAHYREGHTRG